jgi:hypothetical protein
MTNNNYSITGTIYDIRKSEPIFGKKDPSAMYHKYYFTLEIKTAGEKKVGDKVFYAGKTQFPQFEWFNPPQEIIDEFNIGDFVTLDFYCSGQKFTHKKGERAGQEGIISSNIITRMRFADLDQGYSNHKGKKIEVESSTDPKELESITKIFVPDMEDDDFKDLPF